MCKELRSTIDGYDILESLSTPIILINHQCQIIYINGAAEDFLMISKKNIQLLPLNIFFSDQQSIFNSIDYAIKKKTFVVEYETTIQIYNHNEKEITVYISPFIKDEQIVTLTLYDNSTVKSIEQKEGFSKISRSVANMASLLAHEIKNPLSGIRGAAQLLEENLSSDDQILTQLICDEVERIKNLVDRTAIFNLTHLQFGDVNIHSVLDHVKKIAESGFAANININTSYDPSLPVIHADRDLLIQVFINIIKNAAEAIKRQKETGEITIITGYEPNFTTTNPKTKKRITLPLMITVRDNGPGIPKYIQQRLFEPFVSDRPNGTGLGLTLCGKIIHDHGGVIDIHSKTGKTEIKICLPLTGS